MNLTDLFLRTRALLFRARVEQELEDEVEFHMAMSRRRHLAAGHTEEEAGRLARLDFGRTGAIKEDCRGVRGIDAFETALQDIRYALRGFSRHPGFAYTVSGTIALALGLNLALFTLFNAYVLRPLSIRDPYSLYSFTWSERGGSGTHSLGMNISSLFKNILLSPTLSRLRGCTHESKATGLAEN